MSGIVKPFSACTEKRNEIILVNAIATHSHRTNKLIATVERYAAGENLYAITQSSSDSCGSTILRNSSAERC
jgi:hypothetical protein